MSLLTRAEEVPKKWGKEIIITNNSMYCGKILEFLPNARFSMHFHIDKHETWYVLNGTFVMHYIYTLDASHQSVTLKEGDVITIEPGFPHQLYTSTGGRIVEVSTKHNDHDSYRVEKGDSQQ